MAYASVLWRIVLKQRVQTYSFVLTPSTSNLTFCTLALYWRLVLILEWLTRCPFSFPFPHIAHTLAMSIYLRKSFLFYAVRKQPVYINIIFSALQQNFLDIF